MLGEASEFITSLILRYFENVGGSYEDKWQVPRKQLRKKTVNMKIKT